jgi:peptide/nickel transport system permease protein
LTKDKIISPTYAQMIWEQFRRNRTAMIGLYIVMFFFALAFFAPFIAHSLPLTWVDPEGVRTYPLLNEFFAPMNTTEQVLELAFNFCLIFLPLALLAWKVAGRLFPDIDKKASREMALVVGAALALVFVGCVCGVLYATGAGTLWTKGYYYSCGVLGFFVLGGMTAMSAIILTAASQMQASPRWLFVIVVALLCLTPFLLAKKRNDPHDYRVLHAEGKGHGVFALIPYGPTETGFGPKLPPSWWEDELKKKTEDDKPGWHLLGTDEVGIDILVKIIHGARVSLSVGFVSITISTIIGVILGSISAYFGGKIDFIIQRLLELMMSFPMFFLILTIIAIMEKRSILNIMLVIGFTGWTGIARLIRGEVLRQKKMDYVTSAVALGAKSSRTIFRHILPNAIAPVLVAISFGIASAILTEAGLSFLGFGVAPPTPTWGELLNQAREAPLDYWWLVLFPGFLVFLGVFSYNMVGEGIRDAMDPRLRQ